MENLTASSSNWPYKLAEMKYQLLWAINGNQPHFSFPDKEKKASGSLEGLIHQIENRQIPCTFVSPHLDDAVISAGGLINKLSSKTRVSAITIFTSPNESTDTKWARKCGYNNVFEFGEVRKSEDKLALNRINVTEIHHLGFSSKWREKLENTIEVRGRLIDLFGSYMNEIAKSIKEMSDPFGIFFFPIADGRQHLDHLLTRSISTLFEKRMYWREFRFSKLKPISSHEVNFASKHNLVSDINIDGLREKSDAINLYASQLKSLFKNPNVKIHAEKYFFEENLLQ